MAYNLDPSITLGPQNEKRFAELVERFQAAQANYEELRTLQSQRQQEQQQHSFALAGVNIGSDPRELATSYGLRAAQGEIIGVIELRVAEAKKRRDGARDDIDRFVGQLNNLYSGYCTWLQRVAHAENEANQLKAQWLQ